MRLIRRACAGILIACAALATSAAGELGQACLDCHGAQGVSQRDLVPTIAGISAFVHSDALFQYRDRQRPCGDPVEYVGGDTARPPITMCDAVEQYSDDELESLAAKFAALPFVPAKQEFDPAKAAAGQAVHERACERCHTDGGANPEDDAGILAGQRLGYMRKQFDAYAAGERDQPKRMEEKLAPLGAADIEALLHYYASQQ